MTPRKTSIVHYESPTVTSDRLFSLDSDDSSYIQHFDFMNGLKTQEEDIKKALHFSCDDSAETAPDKSNSSVNSTDQSIPPAIFFDNLKTHLNYNQDTNSIQHNFNDSSHPNSNLIHASNTNSNISLGDSSYMESPFVPWYPENEIASGPQCAFDFLDDKEISHLLEGETSLPNNNLREKQVDINEDTIACFNVRNKYDHITAAELFVRENLSFLAIQEPFCSQHKVSESWKAYRMMELQSSRIRCFETPYQVIMFDTWKWGGKVLFPFKSEQHGRVTSIAFEFRKNQKVGFISVYAPTNALAGASDGGHNTTLQITSTLVAKTISKWKAQQSDIQIIILGDMQETISLTDRDNIGKYRQTQASEGILKLLEKSHESIARKIGGSDEYITRFGSEGGRGIDHIFIPNNSHMTDWVLDAKVERQKGAEFFPSDHSLITCTFRRFGQNNNEGGTMKEKCDYRKIYSIKLKQSGVNGDILDLDDSQFKDCQAFREKQELFDKIRSLTNDNSNFTNNRLKDLEDRIKQVYETLWVRGMDQKVNGTKNILVEINEEVATELSYILKKFNEGVQEAMQSLELTSHTNANTSAGKTRGNLRRRKGFKLFANLPASTKLYYLKKEIMSKMKLIQQKLYWLEEKKIRSKHNASPIASTSFWKSFPDIIESSKLENAAAKIHGLIISEIEERSNHVEAIQFKKYEAAMDRKSTREKKILRKPKHAVKTVQKSNFLNTDEKITKKINYWLSRSKCGQAFNSSQSKSTFELLIDKKFNSWTDPLSEIYNLNIDPNSIDQIETIETYLSDAKKDLRKRYSNITRMQVQYRRDTLNYFLDSSQISDFTRKVLPKSRSAPAAHSLIWDTKLGDFRNCLDEAEEMVATSQFHGKWMGNTSAEEVCAYAKLIKKGRLGCRGIRLSPHRKITKKNLNTLLPNHKKLPKHIKESFLKAHNIHTAALFSEPEADKEELFYPFFLTSRMGDMNTDSSFIKNFWKCLSRIPGKARHEGFQMSVVGRFGKRWGEMLLHISKLILIMRFMPPELRKMTRFPIPKPGKSNEYRPISLCNDLYCYINAISTSFSSLGIEKAEILHDGMYAYQKGRGCSSLVTTELCFREDCRENNLPVLQLDEDEEKFFDRVPVEILLAAMRTNGFPQQGFLELKASSMQEKVVEIVTSKGISHAKFVCGLEQGNPDSPTISNLVIKFKHDIWQHLTPEVKNMLSDTHSSLGEYKFQSIDTVDGPVTLSRIGYCDDNSKFCCVKNEEDLLFLAKYFIQLSGDLSMVTKIGRKSSKCELQFFNISAEMALKIKDCWSTAWSYISDGPLEEAVPYKIHMKINERRKFYELINYFNLDEEEQSKWDKIIHPKSHKHLGLNCTLDGDTSASSSDTLSKIHARLNQLNVANMDVECQRKCVNMLCSTMHSFAPMQVNYAAKDLANIDQEISNLLLRKNGLTTTDCRHRIYTPIKHGGLGFISLLDQDLISITRELEIISNLPSLDGRSFRTRIDATSRYEQNSHDDIINHAKATIEKLARYGFFFHDNLDDITNNILAKLNASGKFPSISTAAYKDGNRYSMGSGKPQNINLAYGGPIHHIVQSWRNKNWNFDEDLLSQLKDNRIRKDHLSQIKNQTLEERFMEVASIFSFWEWKNKPDLSLPHISKEKKNCQFFDVPALLKSKFPDTYLQFDDLSIKKEASRILEIDFWNKLGNQESSLFNSYNFFHQILKTLLNKGSPILVSTDGAHDPGKQNPDQNSSSRTTSAFVVSMCDIRQGETFESNAWRHRPSIPLFARATQLPNAIGTTQSDIATGELFAIALSELCLPAQLPRIIITDSKSTRDLLLALRDDEEILENNRNYVRKISGGVSKFIFNLFQNKFKNPELMIKNMTPYSVYTRMQDNMLNLNSIAKSWTSAEEENSELIWEKSYWDNHSLRTIWKVNSHQLNDSGNAIKMDPRYPILLPNLSILSTNHHADVCADYVQEFHQKTYDIKLAYSSLRFSISWKGRTLDRHVSDIVKEKLNLERLKRLRTKPTQGILWRLLHHTTANWDTLEAHKSLQRALLGFSRTHTRCLYKNETYRLNCNKISIERTNTKSSTEHPEISSSKQKLIEKLAPCMWCENANATLTNIEKGNRKHTNLYCSHPNINSFRQDMNSLLNSKLRSFFMLMTECTSQIFSEQVLSKIMQGFLVHQSKNTGRLVPIPAHRNNQYLQMNDLLQKWNYTMLQEAMQDDNCGIMLDIFGITPYRHPIQKGDEETGLIDAPWLGLIPTFVDNLIVDSCSDLDGKCPCIKTRKTFQHHLIGRWDEIKDLILGRAVGLHRVTGSTSKEVEKMFSKEIEEDVPIGIEKTNDDTCEIKLIDIRNNDSPINDKCTYSADSPSSTITVPTSIISTPISIRDTTSLTSSESNNSTKTRKRAFTPSSLFTPNKRISNSQLGTKSSLDIHTSTKIGSNTPTPTRSCPGITCGKESAFWCMECNFNKNNVRPTIRQCQRCSRYMTAMKQANTTLSDMRLSTSDNDHCTKLVQSCRNNKNNLHIHYPSLMNLLYSSYNKEEHSKEAKYTSKNISDRHKIICKIIHKSIIHSCKLSDLPQDIIAHASQFLSLSFSRISNITQTSKNAKKIDPSILPFLRHSSQIKVAITSRKTVLKSTQAIETNSRDTYLGGGPISKAVEVMRARLNLNTYIAHADAYMTIGNWRPELDWQGFARIFSQARVTNEKPNGTYLIPMFSGGEAAGHWYTIVIDKRRYNCEAWIIDSLGSSTGDRGIKTKIQQAFLPGRGQFTWKDHMSRPQSECECGPRTIVAMHTVERCIAQGWTTEAAVQEASFLHVAGEDYAAQDVRLEAALLVDKYAPEMTSRRRQPSHRNDPANDSNRLSARKRRRKAAKTKKKSLSQSSNQTHDAISIQS